VEIETPLDVLIYFSDIYLIRKIFKYFSGKNWSEKKILDHKKIKVGIRICILFVLCSNV